MNFSQGVSKITLKIKAEETGVIELRKGGKDGDKIGNIKYKATDGFDEFSVSVSGIDDLDAIAFVNVAGSCLVDSWTAEPGSTSEEPDEPETPDQPEQPDQPEVPDQPDVPDVPDEPEPSQVGMVNPYERVEAEDSAERVSAKIVPNKESVFIDDGGYVIAKNVDFSKGVSEVKVYAKSTQPRVKLGVYVDGTDTLVGEINIGTDMTSAATLEVTSALSGKHDVYFKAAGGSVQLDAWEASEGTGTVEQPPVVEPPVSGGVNPYSTVSAKDYVDDKKDAMVTPMGASVNILKEGGYFAVKDVNLSNGVSSFTVKAGAKVASVVEIRLDKADGEKIATVRVATEEKEIKTSALTDVSGKHNLYFVAVKGSGINIDTWQAEAGQGTVEQPPVVEPPVSSGVSPYVKTEAETADASLFVNAMAAPAGGKSVVINADGYIRINNLDFSEGLSFFNVYARSSAPRTKLNVYVDDSLTPIGSVDLGTDMSKATELKVSSSITGNHYIYFEAKGGSVTLDAWQAVAASGTVEQPPVVEPPVSGGVNPYASVETETATKDDMSSNVMVTPKKDGITLLNAGSYVIARNVNFSNGVSEITVKSGSKTPAKLEMRVDKADGALLASIMISGDTVAAKKTSALMNLTGTHDIYLVSATGTGITVDSWTATAADGTVEQPPVVEPPVSGTVNPYQKVEAEDSAELSSALLAPNKQSVIINKNGYAVAKNVDLSKGISALTVMARASAGSRLEVRLDKADGESIAMFMVGTEAKELKFNTKASVTGTHDLYFVDVMDGSITLDYWQATAADGTVEQPPVVEPPVSGTVNPYQKVEAEASAELSDARLAPNKQSVLINKNGYAVAKNVDLSKGLSAITVMAKGTAASRLEVRLDKADGERIAMFMVGTEAKELNFNTTASVTGTHDLYFVDTMDGSITFDYWQAKAADGTVVTPPVGNGTNPYVKTEAETADTSKFVKAMLAPAGGKSVVIDAGGYIRIDNLDFSDGLASFNVYARSSAPRTKLNVYIDDSLTPIGTVNVGTDMTKATELKVSSNITGNHYIYFEAQDGSVTLDAWQAVGASGTVVTPPVGQTVDPYNKVEAENANALTGASLTSGNKAVQINDNGYILVQNIDFSKGLSGFGVYAQTNLPKVKLNVYIDDATEPIGSVSVGIDMTKPVYIKLPAGTNVTGTHYIYLEAKGGSVTLDSWNAMPAGSTPIDQPPVVEPPVYEDINPYNKVEAESIPSASYTNAMLTPSKQAVSIMNGGNVVAKNVVFSNGVSEFKVVAGSTASAKLEVRLGSATGTLLGSATVSGDAKELTIKSSQNLSGKKDIYFVSANGVISFDSWKVTEYKEPVVTPPPVVETGVKATYKANAWSDGYQLSFTVTNNSGKTVNSWKVKVKKSDINVSQSWCVNVSQEGDYYVFTPMSWNSTLTNGQSTEFGMIGRGQVGSSINYTAE